jgi:hypothetical protein
MNGEPVTILLPASAARCFDEGATPSVRKACATGAGQFAPVVQASVLYLLAHDPDIGVRDDAVRRLRELGEETLVEVVSSSDIHPRVLDALGRIHRHHPHLTDLVALHPAAENRTLEFLAESGSEVARQRLEGSFPSVGLTEEGEEEAEIDEASEAFLSKYQLLQHMSISEKIKMALTGDKEWRNLFIKDSNKLVSSAVIKNPRITENEILTICRSVLANDEIARLICANREWVKNYQIRKALITNSKTPLAKSLRYLSTLSEKDISSLAKSKNVSSVISTQARRLMAQKLAKR